MSRLYTPERSDVIWLDFEPTKGKEIGKYRPAFVLSSHAYHKKTGLLICCPISTRIRGHVTEVQLDQLDKPSVIVTTMIHTVDWKIRKAKKIYQAEPNILAEVLHRVLPLIGAQEI